jgi:hypothetical protein
MQEERIGKFIDVNGHIRNLLKVVASLFPEEIDIWTQQTEQIWRLLATIDPVLGEIFNDKYPAILVLDLLVQHLRTDYAS